MDWKKWLTFSPYKKLWSIIGQRPWTYIYRDIYREYEWFIQMQWMFTGILMYVYFGWFGVWFFTGAYTYGYINGHFFWGTKIKKGQQGD